MKGGSKAEMSSRSDSKKLGMDNQPGPSSSTTNPPPGTSTTVSSRVPENGKGRRKLKLRDHTKPVHGRICRRKVIIAYKRAHYRHFVRNHTRRVHELHFLRNPYSMNFLDSAKYLKKKFNEKPKSLALLLEHYKVPDQVQLVPVVTRVDITKSKMVKPPEKQPEKQLVKIITQAPLERNLLEQPVDNQLMSLMSLPVPSIASISLEEVHTKSVNDSPPEAAVQAKLPEKPAHAKFPEKPIQTKSPEKSTTGRGPKKFSEKLRAEAGVMQRVAELQKEGMWYDKRLPKCLEPSRIKSHWDYLLEEMVWLATDFAAEKKWKRIAARKCAKMVERYHADKKMLEEKAKKDEKVRVQKIAAFMAKEVRNFWSNVRKLVEYKEQTKIEELRKKTMDQHLSFIVDQTERISSILAESFSTEVVPHRLALQNELVPESVSDLKIFADGMINNLSDDEFLPSPESDDDEETIALAETEATDVRGEVALLKKESQMSIDAVLDDLPKEYVQALLTAESKVLGSGQKVDKAPSPSDSSDQKGETDYEPSESESDFEDTILEEEKLEARGPGKNSDAELKELEEDNELSIDQLRAKYLKSVPADDSDNDSTDVGDTEQETDMNESEDEDQENPSELLTEYKNTAEEEERQSSLATLLQTFAPERAGEDHGDDDELNSVAALAESFQPKGYTLSSTTVATKVPPLLKHTLREYQHIGLDWLVTMYEKKLNGILADEMGLGKTIQTIALLAHLACEKENWGPHLIIVPTSVMLNWEMELLKWFPGFKVLTYYGSIKERKLKRTGWTKPNTFHVCITSYKILIQDHQAFRRKRWRYLILDEAQNIKNFKSQRWQLLLNFSTQRRLLLTGTPLQNNLMELWSLMHFLMPNVFQSHREFREWFSNPMTGMIEGNSEYNENIIRRLHKVLRPFILRRLKSEVEKQLPQKYEHIVLCRLSKRQRYLYEDFMSRAKTKETLQTGSLLSVINVLMQLRKVCNHPNLFEPRPIISPLQTSGFPYMIPSLVWNMNDDIAEKTVTHNIWNITSNELSLDKETADKLWVFGMKNFWINVRRMRGTSILESTSLPDNTLQIDSFGNAIGPAHVSPEDIVSQTDEDEDCSIIYEKKNDPTIQSKTAYSFKDFVVPTPPRLRTPFALFTMDSYPPDSLLTDREFIEALTRQASESEEISESSHRSNLLLPSVKHDHDDGLIEIEEDSKVDIPIPELKRKTRITKLSTSQYPLKLAKTSNGSDVMVTANGVCVQPPEKPKQVKTTNIQYASMGLKREKVYEYENKSLLDTLVVDFEDLPEQESCRPPEASSSGTVPPTKTNGVEDEGSDEYEDSEEESQAPVRKMPRLEKPIRRRKQQKGGPIKISKYTEIDEDDDYGRAGASTGTSTNKRKRPITSTRPKRTKASRLDLSSVDFEDVVYRRLCDRKAVIANLRAVNNHRLLLHTVYGSASLSQTKCFGVMPRARYYETENTPPYLMKLTSVRPEERDHDSGGYFNLGYQEVMMMSKIKSCLREFDVNHPYSLWRHTKGLHDAIWTLKEIMGMFENILKRFVVYTPAVAAPRIPQPTVFHPSVSRYTAIQVMEQTLSKEMKCPLEPLRPIISSMSTQFPDPRLIQYDCGKLQVMDGLLRRLKSESHRALIFTQMAKMLDVLEAFLNHHGYIYLRLDGATKIDQRQILMERFNTDRRIFCFILSTRSGGIGVNLTGADTVIFYDSDWNPTMDAQAQDRCHRIGQTRDVHIYRLVSEKTVEENILKKSNQKKLLGELAIEGGNFTTAHFKKNTIHDIFDVDEGEGDATKRMAEVLDTPVPSPLLPPVKIPEADLVKPEDSSKKSATYMFESALAAAEDDSDVQAARTVRAEAAAELAEFDENIPLDEEAVEVDEPSHIEQEMEYITNELSGIEVYALRFMESTIDDWSKDTYASVQKELELQKLDWEQEEPPIDIKAALRKPPPFADTFEEQLEDLLTYQRIPQEHWYDEEKDCFRIPIYGPPTPPQDDEDIYIDHALALLYDISGPMPEHLLPPVWQGSKKSKGSVVEIPTNKFSSEEIILDNSNKKGGGAVSPSKMNRRDDPIFAPRSLFDRPSPALAKLRRDFKIQKMTKTGTRFPAPLAIGSTAVQGSSKGVGSSSLPLIVPGPKTPPLSYSTNTEVVEWTVAEENQLLQSMTSTMDLPPNLLVVNLAQTPNWDFTTEAVNASSRIYRSMKQCKTRYEDVILPREEGKIVEPVPVPPKKKKSKALVKISPPPPKARRLKTSEIVANDNNNQNRNMFDKKFEDMKEICKDRIPAGNPLALTGRIPKQNSVFAEHNINFDAPLPTPTIALMRLERVMAERAYIMSQRAQQAEQAGKKMPPSTSTELVPVSPNRAQGDTSPPGTVLSPLGLLAIEPSGNSCPQNTVQVFVTRSDVISSPESTHPITVTATSGSNVFVQLGAMESGQKIVQSPTYPSAQSITPPSARSDTSSSPETSRQISPASQSGNNIFVQLTGVSTSPKSPSPHSPSPTYIPTHEIMTSSPEHTRPLTVTTPSGNNIFVQLTGVPPGTKLTQSQIQQLRQSILQQSTKGFVNVVSPPTSPQHTVRQESPPQQLKRIQIVPTTHASMIGTITGPPHITMPVSTSLSPSSVSVTMASQSLNTLTATAGGGNIVAINTGVGTRLVKQQIVGGKAITRPISEADLQMLLKLRGASSSGTNVNAPTITPSGFSTQVSTVVGTGVTEQGDGQGTTITIPVSTISGLPPAVHSQGHTIILPTKGTAVSTGSFSQNIPGSIVSTGSPIITVPMSQTQVIKPKGMPSPQISLVRGPVASGSQHVSSSSLTQVKYSPMRYPTSRMGSLAEQGDGQGTISIPVSGLQAPHVQGQPILIPARSRNTIVTSGAFTQGVTVPSGTQIIKAPVTQTQGVVSASFQKGSGASPQVSLVRGPVPPGSSQVPPSPIMPFKYSPLRQSAPTFSALAEYQKTQPYGIVSAMSLARNTATPTSPQRVNPTRTLDPRQVRSQQTITIPARDNTITINTRPLVATPGVRSQFYTPVSQISLVRGTVPMATTSTTLSTIPVTYSASRMSLLKQPAGELLPRPQLIQRPQQIITIPHGQSSTTYMTGTPRHVIRLPDPPQLVIPSSFSSTTPGILTMYTTTATTTPPTSSAPTSTNPPTSQ